MANAKLFSLIGLLGLLVLASGTAAQTPPFPPDTLPVFELRLHAEFLPDYQTMDVHISEAGQLQCTYIFYDFKQQKKDTIAHKVILLDHNTFRQTKESIAALGLCDGVGRLDAPDWEDGQLYTLKLTLNQQRCQLSGQNREEADATFKSLLQLLDALVGTIAVDYEGP
jgi:hypothetical protein